MSVPYVHTVMCVPYVCTIYVKYFSIDNTPFHFHCPLLWMLFVFLQHV